ncbi:hypothetical protein HKX48_002360 [Thoreauomyces humboldtii]|nr:hypothetical protein HKX48_002360 [Thoreauomyces humboldtii]
MQMLEFFMPVHLERVLVINAPWWARATPFMWKPGVCENGPFSAEISICEDMNLFVDLTQLPRELGGQVHFKHKEWIADQLRAEEHDNEVLVDIDLDETSSPPDEAPPFVKPSPALSLRSRFTRIIMGSSLSSPTASADKSSYFLEQLPNGQHERHGTPVIDMEPLA